MTQPTALTESSPDLSAPPRLLLVEDSEHDRRFFRRILEKAGEGFLIEECSSAEEALELLGRESFDLLLVDLNMPGMNGIELVRRAQDRLADAGVIILTGDQSAEAAAEAVHLQVKDYIFKEPREQLREGLPHRVRVVAQQVRMMRQNRRLERELRLRLAHIEQIHRQMPEAVFATLAQDGATLEINAQAREFLGLEPEEPLVGRPIDAALRNLSLHAAGTVRELLQQGREAQNLYLESPQEGGESRLFLLDLALLKGEAPAALVPKPPHWLLTLREVTPLRASHDSGEFSFHGIVGRDPSILGICELIRRVAPLPTSVLITGQTGSGKEVVARAIHAESDRSEKPFIAVNCTALSREILESELFGHVRGAFTGAINPRKGRFREADGGTLFLDEIGDTTESFQTKLLRALDSGQIEPVGQDRPVQVNVRILCATNQDLPKLVREGRFREDLFYRINVVQIHVPPLSARPGDLPLLIERFRQEFNQRFHKSVRFISQDAVRALVEYHWPGNVRELRHVLERAFVVAEGPTLTRADLPPSVLGQSATATLMFAPRPGAGAPTTMAYPTEAGDPNDSNAAQAPPVGDEAERIRVTLARTGGNIGKAAEALNVHRTTLWRKMRQYGIEG